MSNYRFTELLIAKEKEYGTRFDASDLVEPFATYYRTGQRIKVETLGMTITGTVGITSGWKPVFLLMRRRTDIGSSWTLGASDKLIAIQFGRKYIEVTK